MSIYKNANVFYNSESGHSNFAKHKDMIYAHFEAQKINCKIIEIPKPLQELHNLVSQAIDEGVDLFVAAGGDGTASLIGDLLVGTGKHLGVLPLGTGNSLAKELKVPIKFEKALDLISNDNLNIIQMDTFQLDGRHYLLNLSTGVSPHIMLGTDTREKQRFGFFAYLVHFGKQLLGLKRHRFEISFDGTETSQLASEILITNCRITPLEPLEWADHIKINDGALDLFIIRAANIFDVAGVIISIFTKRQHMNPVIKIFQIKDYCRITSQFPLPTQADGDPVGETPAEITVNPGSLNIIAGKQELYKKNTKE